MRLKRQAALEKKWWQYDDGLPVWVNQLCRNLSRMTIGSPDPAKVASYFRCRKNPSRDYYRAGASFGVFVTRTALERVAAYYAKEGPFSTIDMIEDVDRFLQAVIDDADYDARNSHVRRIKDLRTEEDRIQVQLHFYHKQHLDFAQSRANMLARIAPPPPPEPCLMPPSSRNCTCRSGCQCPSSAGSYTPSSAESYTPPETSAARNPPPRLACKGHTPRTRLADDVKVVCRRCTASHLTENCYVRLLCKKCHVNSRSPHVDGYICLAQ